MWVAQRDKGVTLPHYSEMSFLLLSLELVKLNLVERELKRLQNGKQRRESTRQGHSET